MSRVHSRVTTRTKLFVQIISTGPETRFDSKSLAFFFVSSFAYVDSVFDIDWEMCTTRFEFSNLRGERPTDCHFVRCVGQSAVAFFFMFCGITGDHAVYITTNDLASRLATNFTRSGIYGELAEWYYLVRYCWRVERMQNVRWRLDTPD